MDPPGCHSEPTELDSTLLDFDPDSLLDAWVDDLLAAGDNSAQQDDRPAAMPSGNTPSNMDTSFGGSELALATDFDMTRWAEPIGYIADPLDHFQASEMPSNDFAPRTHDSRTTYDSERFEGQLTNAPGVSQHSALTASTPLGVYPQGPGPDILTRRQLPPKRRGGRRGKLSPEQARQQRETRLSGACIRCRRYNLGVS